MRSTDVGVAVRRGHRIRELRTRAGLTLEQVAEKAKMSIGQLSEIERGKRWRERWMSLERLAAALGVDAAELVVGVDRHEDPGTSGPGGLRNTAT